MPRGLNRTDLNQTGISFKNGTPVTLPHNFGNTVTLPKNFGNPGPFSFGNLVTLPKNFGNAIGGPAFTNITAPVLLPTNESYDLGAVMMNLPNGYILNVYAAGSGQSSTDFVIAMQQSSDGGATWVPYAGTVYGGGTNPNNAQGLFWTTVPTTESANSTVMVTNSGAIVLFWETDTGTFPFNAFSSRSTDNGATWSTPIAMPAGYGVPTNGSVIVVPGGGVCPLFPTGLLAVPILKGDGTSTSLFTSTDDGVTWTLLHLIGNLGATEEVSITWVGGNRLIGFCRNSTGTIAGTTPLIFLWSGDMGSSWTITNSNLDLLQTQPPGSSGLGHYTEISPWFINPTPGLGQVTLLWVERSAWNGIFPAVYNLLRSVTFKPADAIANPLGFIAGELQTIDSSIQGGSVDSGYPSSALLSGTQYLIQWMKNKVPSTGTTAGLWRFKATYNRVASGYAPNIVALSASTGPTGGGTAVTITGSDFVTGATVKFGSSSATSVVFVAPGTITCVTPAGSAGVVNVTVTNPDGQVGTLVNGFNYSAFNPAFVSGGVSGVSTGPVTINTTGATVLIAVLSAQGGAPTVSDSVGGNTNAWNYVTGTVQTGGNQVRIAYAYAKTGGGPLQTGVSHVITPGGTSASCVVYAFSGTATDATVLTTNNQASNQAGSIGTYTLQAGSITPTTGDVVIMGWGNNGTVYNNDVPPAGYTGELKQVSGSTLEIVAACYQLGASGVSQNPSWSVQTNSSAGVVIASFK